MLRRDTIINASKSAVVTSGLITTGVFVAIMLDMLQQRPPTRNWSHYLGVLALTFTAILLISFLWNLRGVLRAQPVWDILEQESPEETLLKAPLFGFVAMEYFAGILNRTYVIFAAPEGLYGWKALGPVTNSNRRYFEPLQDMAADPQLARDLASIQKLAALRGGFFFPQAEISAVASDERNQWGMGGIEHSGHVQLQLRSGRRRRFIVVGNVSPQEVRDRITTGLGGGIPSI